MQWNVVISNEEKINTRISKKDHRLSLQVASHQTAFHETWYLGDYHKSHLFSNQNVQNPRNLWLTYTILVTSPLQKLNIISSALACMPLALLLRRSLIPGFRMQRQGDLCKIKDNLIYLIRTNSSVATDRPCEKWGNRS